MLTENRNLHPPSGTTTDAYKSNANFAYAIGIRFSSCKNSSLFQLLGKSSKTRVSVLARRCISEKHTKVLVAHGIPVPFKHLLV